MRILLTMILLSSVSGCAAVVSDSALCAGTAEAAAKHAAALTNTEDVAAMQTGYVLLKQLEAGCGD